MSSLKDIKYEGYKKTLKTLGISYLGKVAQSSKMMHSYNHHESTYSIYLAPADLSGYNVCPMSAHCKENCLNMSGKTLINEYQAKTKESGVNPTVASRILKTRLFFENREVFMRLMIHEILKEQKKAIARGHSFSVRLNCTSDINPVLFCVDGRNILELFPNIQFYDYTKVPSHIKVAEKYSNYDLTLSYDGYNMEWIKANPSYRFAFVYNGVMPSEFEGRNVIDGDEYDMRYKDPKGCAVGLKVKITANMIKDGKVVIPNTKFISNYGRVG